MEDIPETETIVAVQCKQCGEVHHKVDAHKYLYIDATYRYNGATFAIKGVFCAPAYDACLGNEIMSQVNR
jgi:hypothetical protein